MTAAYPNDERDDEEPVPGPSRPPAQEPAREPYPVLTELRLGRPGKRRFRYWRAPETLPSAPPGAVLVFRTEGGAEVVEDTHLTGHEDAVVEATAVSVVQMRPRSVEAQIQLTTANQALDFTVQVTFTAQVIDAAAVAAQGLSDLPAALTHFLAQDPKLISFRDRFNADDIVAARRAVTAFAIAAYSQSPPPIRGIRLTSPRVDVTTPDPFRTHASAMQDDRWADLREDRRIDRNARLMHTAEQMDAVAVTRGELSMAEAANARREREEAQFERLRVEVEALMRSGAADRVPVDVQHLVASFYNRLAGATSAPQLPTADAQRSAPDPFGPNAGRADGRLIDSHEDEDDGAHG